MDRETVSESPSRGDTGEEQRHSKKKSKHKKHKKHKREDGSGEGASDQPRESGDRSGSEGGKKKKKKHKKHKKKDKSKKEKKGDSTLTEEDAAPGDQGDQARQQYMRQLMMMKQAQLQRQSQISGVTTEELKMQSQIEKQFCRMRAEEEENIRAVNKFIEQQKQVIKPGPVGGPGRKRKRDEDDEDNREDENYRPGGPVKKKKPPPTVNVLKDEDPSKTQKKLPTIKPISSEKVKSEKEQSGGLGTAIVSLQAISQAAEKPKEPEKKEGGKSEKKKEKDKDGLDDKKNPYEIHFYNNLQPQQAGVKKRLIKLYQSTKARKWQTRWVLHPNSRSEANQQDSDVWLQKWVSKSVLDPIIELNADGFSNEDLETLRRLQSVEEIEYAQDFYDFENYLKNFQNTFQCDINNCGKVYFEQRLLKNHMLIKHGVVEKQREEVIEIKQDTQRAPIAPLMPSSYMNNSSFAKKPVIVIS